MIGNDPQLKLKLLKLMHDSAVGGHSEVQATLIAFLLERNGKGCAQLY